MTANPELLARVVALLDQRGVPYQHQAHPPATTTAQLAAVRGADIGCKALLMKGGSEFVVVALQTSATIDNKALRHALGVRRLRFATRDELQELCAVVPGQMPPFGPPVLPWPLLADAALLDQPRMAFTAGTHTDSLFMQVDDWRELAQPQVAAISVGARLMPIL